MSARISADAMRLGTEDLAFEAASVKRNTSNDVTSNFGLVPGGRFVMINGSLRAILAMIYPETPELIGLPEWVSRERYDILATAGREASRAEMLGMLKTLLVERFRFAAHVESKRQATYALTRTRARGALGSGLRESTVNCTAIMAAAAEGDAVVAEQLRERQPLACTVRVTRGRIESRGMNMDALARTIRGPAGRVVIDETGLTGDYEFVLDFNPAALSVAPRSTATPDTRPSIFTALQEQLGLRLESRERGVDTLVVDRIALTDPD